MTPIENLLVEAEKYVWQPIDIPPAEDQPVVVRWPNGVVHLGRYINSDFWFPFGNVMGRKIGFTHWIPLSLGNDIVARLAEALKAAVDEFENMKNITDIIGNEFTKEIVKVFGAAALDSINAAVEGK